MIFEEFLPYLIVFLPAAVALAFFVITLVRFLRGKQPEERKKRRGFLIAASVLLGTVVLTYAGIMILLSIAIRNM